MTLPGWHASRLHLRTSFQVQRRLRCRLRRSRLTYPLEGWLGGASGTRVGYCVRPAQRCSSGM